MRRACARTPSPCSLFHPPLFAAGAKLATHTQPALRTGLMTSAWRLLDVSRRVILETATNEKKHVSVLLVVVFCASGAAWPSSRLRTVILP